MLRSGWRLWLVLVFSTVSVSGVLAAPLLQEGGDPGSAQDVTAVLGKLTQAIGVGWVLSFLFKSPGWFKDLDDKTKWWIIFILSLALPVIAQLLLEFVPSRAWEIINPYWRALSWGFIGWAASQTAFETIIKPARGGE